MDFHVENDFTEICDNLESVTLRVYGKPDVRIHRAVMTEPRSFRELQPTGAQVIRQGQQFIWPKRFSERPPIGSMVIDSTGTKWIVWKLIEKDIVNTYEPICLNLSIVLAPNADNAKPNLATVLVASYVKGQANEAKAVWRGLFTGKRRPVTDPNARPTDTIPARFQPLTELSQIQFNSEFSLERYAVWFDEPWPREVAGGEYRLVDPNGNRYRVMEYNCEERIEMLPWALAVRITEGAEYWGNGTPPEAS
jgi:hypothetical protein